MCRKRLATCNRFKTPHESILDATLTIIERERKLIAGDPFFIGFRCQPVTSKGQATQIECHSKTAKAFRFNYQCSTIYHIAAFGHLREENFKIIWDIRPCLDRHVWKARYSPITPAITGPWFSPIRRRKRWKDSRFMVSSVCISAIAKSTSTTTLCSSVRLASCGSETERNALKKTFIIFLVPSPFRQRRLQSWKAP